MLDGRPTYDIPQVSPANVRVVGMLSRSWADHGYFALHREGESIRDGADEGRERNADNPDLCPCEGHTLPQRTLGNSYPLHGARRW